MNWTGTRTCPSIWLFPFSTLLKCEWDQIKAGKYFWGEFRLLDLLNENIGSITMHLCPTRRAHILTHANTNTRTHLNSLTHPPFVRLCLQFSKALSIPLSHTYARIHTRTHTHNRAQLDAQALVFEQMTKLSRAIFLSKIFLCSFGGMNYCVRRSVTHHSMFGPK